MPEEPDEQRHDRESDQQEREGTGDSGAGAHKGRDAGADGRATDRRDTGADDGRDAGADSRTNDRRDSGADSRADDGQDTGTDTRAEPGSGNSPRRRPGRGRSGTLGPVLPDRASEDDPRRWGDRDEDDDRIWREVPPHHG